RILDEPHDPAWDGWLHAAIGYCLSHVSPSGEEVFRLREEIIREYEEAIRFRFETAEVYNNKAHTYLRFWNDPDKAKENIDQALKLSDNKLFAAWHNLLIADRLFAMRYCHMPKGWREHIYNGWASTQEPPARFYCNAARLCNEAAVRGTD